MQEAGKPGRKRGIVGRLSAGGGDMQEAGRPGAGDCNSREVFMDRKR
ncbi:MAG: hypothetical protein HFH38_10405 [Lachnospiraceae bacterium]|nr:hypothetical protein [Lachnospiraceae bacterium]